MRRSLIFFIALLFFLIVISLITSMDVIRPANQIEDRGVGVQIRPANQINQPSDGNGGYKPTQGSSYSSRTSDSDDSEDENNINLKSVINGTNEVNSTESAANGTGLFILNEDENTLTYSINYEGLSSNETGAHIHGPAVEGENIPILYNLPLGLFKSGTINYNEEEESDILSGLWYVNIHSLLFPEGEIIGQIVTL